MHSERNQDRKMINVPFFQSLTNIWYRFVISKNSNWVEPMEKDKVRNKCAASSFSRCSQNDFDDDQGQQLFALFPISPSPSSFRTYARKMWEEKMKFWTEPKCGRKKWIEMKWKYKRTTALHLEYCNVSAIWTWSLLFVCSFSNIHRRLRRRMQFQLWLAHSRALQTTKRISEREGKKTSSHLTNKRSDNIPASADTHFSKSKEEPAKKNNALNARDVFFWWVCTDTHTDTHIQCIQISPA